MALDAMSGSGPPSTFGGVVQLINRLQRACGDIGENAASDGGDSGIPALWNLLPSIVVIGGQVTPHTHPIIRASRTPSFVFGVYCPLDLTVASLTTKS